MIRTYQPCSDRNKEKGFIFICKVLSLFAILPAFAEGRSQPNKRLIDTNFIVKTLRLEPHIEGGYFKRTYLSDQSLIPKHPRKQSKAMSSIFYLLSENSPVGQFHLNKSDIVHYFHIGDPITYYLIYPDGALEMITLGSDLAEGQSLQLAVPGGVWKASKLDPEGARGFGLISEAVSPAFDYEDMILGAQEDLIMQFPQHSSVIREIFSLKDISSGSD